MAREAGIRNPIHWRDVNVWQAPIFNAFVRLHAAIDNGADALEQQSRLAYCLDNLTAACAENRPVAFSHVCRGEIQRARDYLRDNWNRRVTLQELAGIAGLGQTQFLRAFTRNFGLPPHAFQTTVRITKAQDLLKKGFPSGQLDLGYADQSHFIRHFKRETGVTPAQYARMTLSPRVFV